MILKEQNLMIDTLRVTKSYILLNYGLTTERSPEIDV